MQHYAAFQLCLYCLQKYSFRGFKNLEYKGLKNNIVKYCVDLLTHKIQINHHCPYRLLVYKNLTIFKFFVQTFQCIPSGPLVSGLLIRVCN